MTLALHALLAIFICLQIAAALLDVKSRVIPNWLSLAVAVCGAAFIAGTLAAGIDMAWQWHLATAFGVLVLGFILFAANVFGGGDAKLLAANALWAGPTLVGGMLLIVAISGGLLAAGWWLVLKIQIFRMKRSGRLPPVNHFSVNLPYGLAIAAGAVFVGWRLLEQIP